VCYPGLDFREVSSGQLRPRVPGKCRPDRRNPRGSAVSLKSRPPASGAAGRRSPVAAAARRSHQHGDRLVRLVNKDVAGREQTPVTTKNAHFLLRTSELQLDRPERLDPAQSARERPDLVAGCQRGPRRRSSRKAHWCLRRGRGGLPGHGPVARRATPRGCVARSTDSSEATPLSAGRAGGYPPRGGMSSAPARLSHAVSI